MKRKAALFLVFLLALLAAQAAAQLDRINIPAGTPEDRDLQAISNEQDAAKKLAMYVEFVQKYPSNLAAVAYGNAQISQAYQPRGTWRRRSTMATRRWPRSRGTWIFWSRRPASLSRRRTITS